MEAAVLAYQTIQALPCLFFQQQAQSTGKSVYGPIYDYRGGRNSHTVYNPDGTDHGIITMGPVQNSAPLSSSNAMELGTLAPSRYPQHISGAERTCHCNLGLCLYCRGPGSLLRQLPSQEDFKDECCQASGHSRKP